MREEQILKVLDDLDAAHVSVRGNNVIFSCILAPWTHAKRADRHPAMAALANDGGPSPVNCLACGFASMSMQKLIERYELLSGQDVDDVLMEVVEAEERDPSTELLGVDDYEVTREDIENEEGDGLLPEVLYERFQVPDPHPYVLGRGFSPETLRLYEAGFDVERERVTFPVRDRRQRFAGCLGRTVCGGEPKWHTYWGTEKSKHLFGAQLLPRLGYAKASAPLVIVEGPFDAIRVYQETRGDKKLGAMIPLAIMGNRPSRHQVALIKDCASSCVFLLDNDQAGTIGTRILMDQVAPHVPSWVGHYPDGRKDPDELGADVVLALRETEMI